MRLRFIIGTLLLPALLLALKLAPARAELVYDNSDTGGTNVYYSLLEYGDEIILTGTNRVISEFSFEYFGDFTPTGDETARLRLYKMDGPKTADGDPTPGTVLYDSGVFSISPGYYPPKFTGLSVTVPTDVTWTVEFGGLTGITGDRAGLVFRDKPSAGSSFDDFWLKQQNNWKLFSWGGDPVANFAARIVSGAEPTSISIQREADQVVVKWTGASILQAADSANGPYKDLSQFHTVYKINPAAGPMKFWRLRD